MVRNNTLPLPFLRKLVSKRALEVICGAPVCEPISGDSQRTRECVELTSVRVLTNTHGVLREHTIEDDHRSGQ